MMRGGANPILSAGVAGLRAMFEARDITPTEALEAHLSRIARLNPNLNCVVALDEANARRAAKESAARFARGKGARALEGVPILVKANIAIAGLPWTNALKAWRGRIAHADAFVVARLRGQGAIILGHVNMHEAALGATTTSPLYGQAYNPARQGFTPGGSSGGSAACVAAAFAPAALGTDTMGSVRIPSAYCGVFGFKPSYGRVSLSGVSALSARLDHVGVHARSVRDLALIASALDSFDAADPCSRAMTRMKTEPLSLSGLRVGRLQYRDAVDCSADVNRAFDEAVSDIAHAGGEVTDCRLSDYDFSAAVRDGLLLCEADLAAMLTDDEQSEAALSPELFAMLGFAKRQSAPRLAKAQTIMARATASLRIAFSDFDVLISPTAPQTAFPATQTAPPSQAFFTALANFAGVPAVTIPAPVKARGLPVGLQVMAPEGKDALALSVAEAIHALWQ